MFTDFFIKRPVFATVISIIIILAGVIALPSLPISQYPAVAPPQIQVNSTYIGASAEQVESSCSIGSTGTEQAARRRRHGRFAGTIRSEIPVQPEHDRPHARPDRIRAHSRAFQSTGA